MELGIAGRKAIVCASSKGLGRACARALAEAGCLVVLNGRDKEALDQTARELRQATGVEVREVLGDLDHPATRAELIAACPDADILSITTAARHIKGFGEITREDILKGVESNMLTPIALVQALAPGMAERKFGRIVNITSGSVRAPVAGLDVSSGARAGLTAFLASAARLFARDNVTINSIQPGSFETDRQKAGLARAAAQRNVSVDTARADSKARIPVGRFGDPAEFGALCAFLASAHAGFITGSEHPHRWRRVPGGFLSAAERSPAADAARGFGVAGRPARILRFPVIRRALLGGKIPCSGRKGALSMTFDCAGRTSEEGKSSLLRERRRGEV